MQQSGHLRGMFYGQGTSDDNEVFLMDTELLYLY